MSNPCLNDEPTNSAFQAAVDLFGLDVEGLSHIDGGRVNETFMVQSRQGRFILQKLNDFFHGSQALGQNWQTVFQALKERSGAIVLPIPAIIPDIKGRLLSSAGHNSSVWRLTEFIEGRPAPKTASAAKKAGRLLGSIHYFLNFPSPLELEPLPEGEFTNQRLTLAEDFSRLTDWYRGHPNLESIKPLIQQAEEAALQLPLYPGFVNVFQQRDVIIHGDPKADNFIFNQSGEILALLDWDTVGYGHVLIDIAEMLRSWNVYPEATVISETRPGFENLAAVLEGYGQSGLELQPWELELLPPVLRGIALNLARRYLTDALAEVYFKWDNRKWPSLHHQNRARAQAMLNLSENLLRHEIELSDHLVRAYSFGRESGDTRL